MGTARKVALLQAALASQWLPLSTLRALQLRRLRGMLSFCERHVPLYRESFRRAGVTADDLRQLEDLRHFPTVTREEIVDAYPDGVLSRAPRPADVVFRTSGTSGLAMHIAYSEVANDWLDAVYARALLQTGYRPWDRLAYFWWEEEPKPERAYERLGVMRKHYLPMDPDPRAQLEELHRIKPRYIYNFPSVMSMIARIVAREGLGELRPQGIICHGELMPKPIQREISRAFGCPVWNQYGAQELNRLGWDCEMHDAMHLDADSVVLEVLDGDRVVADGEEGELVFTGLHNRLMPLVRYRIGDAGKKIAGPCACGRGLPLFEITEGRVDDLITLPSGRHIGPRVIAPAIERIDGITQYRLIQRDPEHFEVLLVKEPGVADDVESKVASTVRELIPEAAHVETKPVSSISLNRRGKLRKVVSDVAAST